MTHGPGRYDFLASHVMAETTADAALVVVVGGNRGHGFSVQLRVADDDEGRVMLRALVGVLRETADQMERDALSGNKLRLEKPS